MTLNVVEYHVRNRSFLVITIQKVLLQSCLVMSVLILNKHFRMQKMGRNNINFDQLSIFSVVNVYVIKTL